MHRLFLFASITFLLMVALPAVAQYDDPCGVFRDANCNPIVENPDSTGTGGGADVNSCTAYAQFGNKCIDCVIPFMPRPGQPTGPSCQLVTYSASCTCDSAKCSTDTTGALKGSCTYHQ